MASLQKKRFIQPLDDVRYHILEEIDKHWYATIIEKTLFKTFLYVSRGAYLVINTIKNTYQTKQNANYP